MKKMISAVFMLLMGFGNGAFAVFKDIPRALSLGVPFAESHITINGHLEEWGDLSGFRSLMCRDTSSNRPGLLNNDMTLNLQWDADYLFIACFVHDRYLNAASFSDLENARQDDAIELFFDTHNDAALHMDDNDYQMVVGINNNINEMRGSSERRKMGEVVPRVPSRDLDCRLYVRLFGTVNDNRDLDSGYALEMSISWKSLGINPLEQNTIRIDFGNLDLDTSDFKNPAIWQGPYYSEYLYGDITYSKSPKAWPVIELKLPSNPALLTGKNGLKSDLPWYIWIAGVIALLLLAAGFLVYYRRVNAMNETVKNQVLGRLQQYLQEHFKEKVTLEDFCRLYNYPDARVSRILKSYYKNSFTNVILQKRMEEAKRLLETTEKNVTEVCFDVGFNDASYFTKSFKAFFNMLPKDVKKKRPVA